MRIPGIPYLQGINSYTDADGRHYGFAIHATDNDASDTGEAQYATWRPDGISAHFIIDADSVTQSLDTDARAGHAGSTQGNQNSIAFEFVGTNDKTRAWWLENVAWDQIGNVMAYILQHDPDYQGFQLRRASITEMRANPTVKAFYGHDDMRQAWGSTTHKDPGPNFPWDRLFTAVNDALNPKPRGTSMGQFIGLTDGPKGPGAIYFSDHSTIRHVASMDSVSEIIRLGGAPAWKGVVWSGTVAAAEAVYGVLRDSLKGASGPAVLLPHVHYQVGITGGVKSA